MSADNPNNKLVIPTGEASVGRVSKKEDSKDSAPVQAAPSDRGPQPVLEHAVRAPQDSEVAPKAAAAAEEAEPQALATAPDAAEPAPPATEALQPEPVLSEPAAVAQEAIAPPPLQESVQLSIPERMNQLHSENKRLRSEMEALERALQKPMS
jgi:hypothetical protein